MRNIKILMNRMNNMEVEVSEIDKIWRKNIIIIIMITTVEFTIIIEIRKNKNIWIKLMKKNKKIIVI